MRKEAKRPRGKLENVIKIAPYGQGRHEISFMAETTRQLSAHLRRLGALAVLIFASYTGVSEPRIDVLAD